MNLKWKETLSSNYTTTSKIIYFCDFYVYYQSLFANPKVSSNFGRSRCDNFKKKHCLHLQFLFFKYFVVKSDSNGIFKEFIEKRLFRIFINEKWGKKIYSTEFPCLENVRHLIAFTPDYHTCFWSTDDPRYMRSYYLQFRVIWLFEMNVICQCYWSRSIRIR